MGGAGCLDTKIMDKRYFDLIEDIVDSQVQEMKTEIMTKYNFLDAEKIRADKMGITYHFGNKNNYTIKTFRRTA